MSETPLVWQRPYFGNQVVTSSFGPRSGEFHYGTDYGLACNTKVYAVADGIVEKVTKNGLSLGNTSTPETPANSITLKHESNWGSFYTHLNSVAVSPGQKVYRGMYLGRSGNTGFVRGSEYSSQNKQGCHLHLGLSLAGEYIDPEQLLTGAVPNFIPVHRKGILTASFENPYGHLDGRSYLTPKLVIRRRINDRCNGKWNTVYKQEKLHRPVITYIE